MKQEQTEESCWYLSNDSNIVPVNPRFTPWSWNYCTEGAGGQQFIEDAKDGHDTVFLRVPALDSSAQRLVEVLSFLGLVPEAKVYCLVGDELREDIAAEEHRQFEKEASLLVREKTVPLRCLYDYSGNIPSLIPRDALTLTTDSDERSANPWTIEWDEDWLYETLMDKGEKIAKTIACRIPSIGISRAADGLEQCLDKLGYGFARNNFEALSCEEIAFPLTSEELLLARQISEREHDRHNSQSWKLDISLMKVEPLMPAARKILHALGDEDGMEELYNKVVNALKLSRILFELWKHAVRSSQVPVEWRGAFYGKKLSISATSALGRVIGVPSLIDSYLSGIPMEDILA